MPGGGVVAGASGVASEGKRTAALRAMLAALKRRGRGASGSRSASPPPERGSGSDPLAEWRRRAAAKAALLERGYAPAPPSEAEGDAWAEHGSFSACAASFAAAAQRVASSDAPRDAHAAELIAHDVAAALALARSQPARPKARPALLSKATAVTRAPPAHAPAAPAALRLHDRVDTGAQLPPPAREAPSAAGRAAERTPSNDSDPSVAEGLQQRVARVLAASAAVLDASSAEEERIAAALALAAAPQEALTDDEGGLLRHVPLLPAPLRVSPSPPRPTLRMGEAEDALAAWRRRRREEAASLGAAAPPAARAAAAAAEAAEAAAILEEAAAAALGPPQQQPPPPLPRGQSPPAEARELEQPARAAAPRAPLARRALQLDDASASAWPAHSAPSDATYALLHAAASGTLATHAPAAAAAAAGVFPPRSPSASPTRRVASPPARRPSPPPLSLGPSAADVGAVPLPPPLRRLALPTQHRGREDAAPRAAAAWAAASWPNHGGGAAFPAAGADGCESPPPTATFGAASPGGGDDVVAALLQGTVEALLFGGGGAPSDPSFSLFGTAEGGGSASSGSASGRVPDAFWPPEMSAEAPHGEATQQQQQQQHCALPPPAWQPQPQPAAPAWLAAADDTPSPDGTASSGDSDVAGGEATEDPVVAALLARIAACRAELRALETPSR